MVLMKVKKQKAEVTMGHASMRMRNNTSKIRWGLAGYVESRIYAWKPQASGCKGGTAQGKRPAH